jgi:hypothetical protein
MFDVRTQPQVVVPLAEGTVLTVQGPAAITKKVHIENLDSSNTLTWKFQSSDDGVTWTDVAASTTLAPLGNVHVDLVAHIMHRLRASGDLDIAVECAARTAFSGTISFLSI